MSELTPLRSEIPPRMIRLNDDTSNKEVFGVKGGHRAPSVRDHSVKPHENGTLNEKLINAINRYDTIQATSLLKEGAQYDLPDENGNDALYYAIYRDLLDVVKIIMAKLSLQYQQYKEKIQKRQKKTLFPLVYAAQNKKEDIALHILSVLGRSSMLDLDERGASVLYIAIENKLFNFVDKLLLIIEEHRLEFDSGLWNPLQTHHGYAPLHAAIDNSYITKGVAATKEGENIMTKYSEIAIKLIHILPQSAIDEVSELPLYNGATPLIICTQNENEKVAEKLIEKRANVNALDKFGKTAFHYAAEEGSVKLLELLVVHGVDVNSVCKNSEHKLGWTGLYFAIDMKRVEAVKYLLSKEVLINVIDSDLINNRPIVLTCVRGEYDEDEKEIPALECLKLLLNSKYSTVDINAPSPNCKTTALVHVVKEGKIKMATYLLNKGSKVNLADIDGKTALHYAVSNLSLPMVELLLENGADPTIYDNENMTPLMLCVQLAADEKCQVDQSVNQKAIFEEILKVQVKSPSNLLISDFQGRNVLHLAISHGLDSFVESLIKIEPGLVNSVDIHGDSPLIYAARVKQQSLHAQSLKNAHLLIRNGAQVNHKGKDGRTAVHNAVLSGFVGLLEMLVDCKRILSNADINAKDVIGFTPLMLAAQNPSTELRDMGPHLIRLGANVQDVDSEDKTALHHAAICGNESISKALLRKFDELSVSSNSLDKAKFSPVHYAAKNKRIGVLNIIITHGRSDKAPKEPSMTKKELKELLDRVANSKFEAFSHHIFIEMMLLYKDQASRWLRQIKEVIAYDRNRRFLNKSLSQTHLSTLLGTTQSDLDSQMDDSSDIHPLIKNAEDYSNGLYSIINSLTSVKSDPCLTTDFEDKWRVAEDDFIVAGSESLPSQVKEGEVNECEKLWQKKTAASKTSSLIQSIIDLFFLEAYADVEAYTIEIPYISSVEFLEACVIVSDKTGRKDIFKNEVVKVAIEQAWYSYGLRYHTIHFAFYIALAVINSACNYLFMEMSGRGDFSLVYTNISIASLFLAHEFLQLLKSPIEYITTLSNFFDLATFVFMVYGNSIRIYTHGETDNSAALVAVSSVMLYFDFLFFLRPYKATGALIGMIEAITWAIRYYVLVLGLVLYGFSQALFVLSYLNVGEYDDQPSGLDFTTPGQALLHAFTFMLGGAVYPPDLAISNPGLATLLIVMLVFITYIVLLNLLISLMSNIFASMKESADEEWRKKICMTILEQVRFTPPYVPKYTHYLKRVQDSIAEQSEVNEGSILTELRDQFYPLTVKFKDHPFEGHTLYRKTHDESGFIKISCNVCKQKIADEGKQLLYSCQSCVFTAHLHCVMPSLASDAHVQELHADIDKKFNLTLDELHSQNYPFKFRSPRHHPAHTLSCGLIPTSSDANAPILCGVCNSDVRGQSSDMYFKCGDVGCNFQGHLQCCLIADTKDAKLDLILNQLKKRTYH